MNNHRNRRPLLAATVFATTVFATLAFAALAAPALAEPFTLTPSGFTDGGPLPLSSGGNDKAANPNCRGENISPAFAWSNVPAGTTSFVWLMYDPEGQGGLGVSHQVAYGIPATATGFAQGALSGPGGFIGGKSTPGKTAYYGGCPPPNTGQHHYIFSILATDLPADALEPNLTREQLFEKLKGHTKGTAAVVGKLGY